jgi:hypothetical protein
MPNAIVRPGTTTPAVSPQALPASLKQALADPVAFGDHPDVAWRLPDSLPPLGDLKAAVALLEQQLKPADRRHASHCLGKLLVAFNERRTADEAKLLLEVWVEACAELPADLWSAGTLALVQSHRFGLPRPRDLLAEVAQRLAERRRMLDRTRVLLHRARAAPPSARRFVAEPYPVRLAAMRDSLRRVGQPNRAARYERELAALEERLPAAWALEVPA